LFGGPPPIAMDDIDSILLTSSLHSTDNKPLMCLVRKGNNYWTGILQPKGRATGYDILYVRYV